MKQFAFIVAFVVFTAFVSGAETDIILPGGLNLQTAFVAVTWVESRCNQDKRDGDAGRAVGPAQIWPIMVADANRIVGKTQFTLEDRRDWEKSFQIFTVIVQHYKCRTMADIVRRWNRRANVKKYENAYSYFEKTR